MIIIRVQDDCSVCIFDEDTAIDANDCLEIETAFDTLTIEECLLSYKRFIERNKKGKN